MTLRIAYGNGHNEEQMVRFAVSSKADSVALLETVRQMNLIRNLVGYRCTSAGGGWDDRRANNIAILTKNERRNLGEFKFLVSQESDAFPAAHERVLLASFYGHPLAGKLNKRGFAHFAWHPTPAPEKLTGKDKDAWVVKQYHYGAEVIREQMELARQFGYVPILTTDAQVQVDIRRPWTLPVVLGELPWMGRHTDGIDHVWFDRRNLDIADIKTVKLYDHPGFIIDFKGAKK